MDEILLGRYYVKEFYAASDCDDPRCNNDGDILHNCQYNIVKHKDSYLVTDTLFTCASFSSLDELMQDMGLRDDDIFWE